MFDSIKNVTDEDAFSVFPQKQVIPSPLSRREGLRHFLSLWVSLEIVCTATGYPHSLSQMGTRPSLRA